MGTHSLSCVMMGRMWPGLRTHIDTSFSLSINTIYFNTKLLEKKKKTVRGKETRRCDKGQNSKQKLLYFFFFSDCLCLPANIFYVLNFPTTSFYVQIGNLKNCTCSYCCNFYTDFSNFIFTLSFVTFMFVTFKPNKCMLTLLSFSFSKFT